MDKKSLNIALIILTILVATAFGFSVKSMRPAPLPPDVINPNNEETPPDDENQESQFVNVFFIGQNKNGEEVYKAVKRKYDPAVDGTPVKFAITALFDGPKPEESKLGVYSEIPVGTRLLNVVDASDGVYINLSKHFETGGGTDSIYKRIFQLIKTTKYNTNKPVYLLIENEKVEVLGGDGIMITQPLTENSLGG
ncbi:MAG: GerMN domain-containing protein [Fusobacterium sp.]|nr:GerMN domain-containing protein [Fusobacterium sp.]